MLGVMYSKDSMRKVGEIWFLIMSIFLDFCVDEFDDNWKEQYDEGVGKDESDQWE